MNLAQALVHAFTQEGITLCCGMGGNSTRAMADAAYASGDTTQIRKVEELIELRLRNENAILGSFIAVGRD